jgi:hypothetical protein
MVMRMSNFPPLLLIPLVLMAGCLTTVQKDNPAGIPAPGSLQVSSTPPGAEVYLDTVYQGTTPVTVFGKPGPHTLELRLRDYQSWSKAIVVEEGAKVFVDTALAPVPVITSLTATAVTTRSPAVPTTRPRPTTSEASTIPTMEPIPFPTTTQLTTPTPFSPATGQVFIGINRTTTFSWSPVSRAEKYLVEVQDYIPSRKVWQNGYYEDILATSWTVTLWIGAGTPSEPVNSFRWRVTAKNQDLLASSVPSEWRYFTWQDQ